MVLAITFSKWHWLSWETWSIIHMFLCESHVLAQTLLIGHMETWWPQCYEIVQIRLTSFTAKFKLGSMLNPLRPFSRKHFVCLMLGLICSLRAFCTYKTWKSISLSLYYVAVLFVSWYRSIASLSVVISLEWQYLCLDAFGGCRLRFRLKAQGSVLYNRFSCFKAFDTQDTGPRILTHKKETVVHEVQHRGSIWP